ncbi:hypothetical protein I503_04166 [Candida albicans SC5314]|nr:hypothetical protein I503_04166 [Candida albicans SC5314]
MSINLWFWWFLCICLPYFLNRVNYLPIYRNYTKKSQVVFIFFPLEKNKNGSQIKFSTTTSTTSTTTTVNHFYYGFGVAIFFWFFWFQTQTINSTNFNDSTFKKQLKKDYSRQKKINTTSTSFSSSSTYLIYINSFVHIP